MNAESRDIYTGEGANLKTGNFLTGPQIRRRIALGGAEPVSLLFPPFLDIPSHMCHSMFPLGYKSVVFKISFLWLFLLFSSNTYILLLGYYYMGHGEGRHIFFPWPSV